MPADIFLLAGVLDGLMERGDMTDDQRRAIRAVLNAGEAEGPQMTKEDCDIVRAFALSICETE